jgi:NADPH:quinone reductase
MRAIEISRFGPPEGLRMVERPEPPLPAAGSGEVRVRVTASGLNRPDVLQRKGHYPPPPGASDLPGLEVAGMIEGGDEAAMQAAGLSVGQRVCALLSGGGYAERCIAAVEQCLPVPAGLSDLEAASLPETFFTVWSNVFDRARLQPGETILIQGGGSGIGVTAIQLARAFGARVLVTAGSAAKCQACLDLGADHALNYLACDFAAEVQRLTDGRGVDVILDMVAGNYLAREISCLAEDGRLVVIGVQGGVRADGIDASLILRKRLVITGSTLRPRPLPFKAAIARALRAQVWPLIESGQIRPVLAQVYAADDVVAAHTQLDRHEQVGKIVLDWSPR